MPKKHIESFPNHHQSPGACVQSGWEVGVCRCFNDKWFTYLHTDRAQVVCAHPTRGMYVRVSMCMQTHVHRRGQ